MLVNIMRFIFSKTQTLTFLSLNIFLFSLISATFFSTESFAANNSGSCWISSPQLNFGTVSSRGGTSNTNVRVTCNHYNHSKPVNLTLCLFVPEGNPTLANNRRRITSNRGSGSDYLSYDLFYDAALTQRIDTTANTSSLRCIQQSFSTSENQKSFLMTLYGHIYPAQNVSATSYRSFNMPITLMYASSEDSIPSAQDVISNNQTATNNLLVTAEYENGCNLQSVPDLNFGQTNNLLQEKTNSTTISLYCPTNTTWKIGLDNGLNYDGISRRMRKGVDYIPYYLYKNSNFTQIWDSNSDSQGVGNNGTQQIRIYGKVPIQNKLIPAGEYSDTVTVTLTY